MENKDTETVLEQYKAYNYSKEQFINRSFAANRFYTVLCIVFLLLAYIMIIFSPEPITIISIGILGMFISALWWLNTDSYNVFIKIKYKNVLDVIENSLPAKPFQDEFASFIELKKNKKKFVFSDVQKFFATLVFIVFMIIVLMQIVQYIIIHTASSF